MKRDFIEQDNKEISITKQLSLLGLSKMGLYYQPRSVSDQDQRTMEEIDKIYTEYPFYGSRRIKVELLENNIDVGRMKISTLMKTMGIEAIYPKKNLSIANKMHKKFPYLLRDVEITRANQVFSTDITYIRLKKGFAYLVAVIDWYSRYVLSWRLSTSLEGSFCQEALKEALTVALPEIFNTDQGSQFTDKTFIAILEGKEIQISMDGKGRALDNVFVERLWRSVKYENIFLNNYETVKDCRNGLKEYFDFYNFKRKHQSLGYKTPAQVYQSSLNICDDKARA